MAGVQKTTSPWRNYFIFLSWILLLNKTGGARDLLFFVLSVDSQKANVFNLAGLNIANWEKFFHCVGPAIASLLNRTLLWSLSTVKDSSSLKSPVVEFHAFINQTLINKGQAVCRHIVN